MASDLLQQLRLNGPVPRHVAVIMDGNGRWARERGRPREFGHRAGMRAVREAVEAAGDAGVEVLTLFAFSQENWHRPQGEVAALMTLLELYVRKERRELKEKGVEVHAVGQLHLLGPRTRAAIQSIVEHTRGGTKLKLNLAISYGSRAEIVHAARRLAERVREGTLMPGEIDEELFAEHLYTPGDPDPDLLIRTSGEMRISNFMLWQLAYTELHVSPVLWPDFTREHFFAALLEYQQRERRFGRVLAT
ncbi:isoprenyl transferase [Longimicrobium sp.]|uniref:isoprenyl transferase n=1 Tax=Longimicrobium sp. TaxID=2029185 RepID=UPI002C3FCDD0|nr:isoprenyl transferase [Longimicrobium sp.]HSU13709.1 isoprenyl transferase [Longimicrobium sp.]